MSDFNIPFEEYKKIDAIHYSLLKKVADSGHLYKFETKKESEAMDLGSLVDEQALPVDTILGESDLSKYIILEESPPTATTLDLANLVIDRCLNAGITYDELLSRDENDNFIFKILEEYSLWSNNTEKVKKSKYQGNDKFYNYIKSKLAVVSGKIVISPKQWEKANELTHILKTHKYTKDIFSDGLNQVSYVFSVDGVTYKIRIDKLIIDKKNRVLKPYDLKTGQEKATKFIKNFYLRKYYLQQALYSVGVLHLASKYYPDFTVDPFRFVYISTTEFNPYPIIWEMSEKWAELGWEGFISNGVEFKGVKQLVNEFKFYEQRGHDVPMEVHEHDGVMEMPLPY